MKPGRPLYLARASYRRRRLIDAARLLPVLAAVLFILPVLWAPRPGAERSLATDGIYVFVAWGLLILGMRLLVRGLASPGAAPPSPLDEG